MEFSNRGSLRYVGSICTLALVVCSIRSPWHEDFRNGCVMIDDALSQEWEPAGRLCSTDWYGDFSMYGMSGLAETIGMHSKCVVINGRELNAATLHPVSVLVLKIPEADFRPGELLAVEEWVRGGGRLMLVGDHTDLFGGMEVLNRLASLAGMHFRNDSVGDARSGGFTYATSGPYGSLLLGSKIKEYELMTGCSIETSLGCVNLLSAGLQQRTSGDYSRGSNFGVLGSDCDKDVCHVCFCACGRLGKGQITLWADSTVMSTFALSMYSRWQMFCALVEWNRMCLIDGVLIRLVRLATIGLSAVGFVLLGGKYAGRLPFRIPAVLVLIACCWSERPGIMDGNTPATSSTVDDSYAVLGYGLSRAAFPPALGTLPSWLDPVSAYDTICGVLWREGIPNEVVKADVWEDYPELSGYVVIAPTGKAVEYSKVLLERVNAGANLIVLLRGDGFSESEMEFCQKVGFSVEWDRKWYQVNNGRLLASCAAWGCRILEKGHGKVVLIYGCEALSRKHWGHCMEFPDGKSEALYRLWDDIAVELNWPDRCTRRRRVGIVE